MRMGMPLDAVSPAGRAFDEAARRLMGEDVPLELPKVRPQFSRRLKSSIRVLRGAQERNARNNGWYSDRRCFGQELNVCWIPYFRRF